MKLLIINYEDAGNLKSLTLPEGANLNEIEIVQDAAEFIDQGIGDLIKFENGFMFQAMVEKVFDDAEETEAEEGEDAAAEPDPDPQYHWEITWAPVREVQP